MKNHVLSLAITIFVSSALSIAQAAPPVTKSGPSAPVEVTNTTQNPVPVSIVQPAIEPVQQINICGVSQLGNPTKVLYTAPTDKRLEIDFASMTSTRFLNEGEALYVFITTETEGVVGTYLVGSVRGDKGLADSRLMKVIADPATKVIISQASSSSSPFLDGDICLSGRLVPI